MRVASAHATETKIGPAPQTRAYRRNGIQEYIVWLTTEKRIRWFHLTDQEYVEQKEHTGRLSSKVFPGLVLDVKALLRGDKAKVLAARRRAQ